MASKTFRGSTYRVSIYRILAHADLSRGLPYLLGWEKRGAGLQPADGISTLSGQAVYDAWREVEGAETPLGLIYFEEIHHPA